MSYHPGVESLSQQDMLKRRQGIGAIMGVLLFGVLIIVGSASIALYVLPGGPGSSHGGQDSATTITSTITTHVVSYSVSTIQSTVYQTQTSQLVDTSTLTSTQVSLSTQTTVVTSTTVVSSTTTVIFVAVLTITVTTTTH